MNSLSHVSFCIFASVFLGQISKGKIIAGHCQPGNLTRYLASWIFTGGWSCGQPLHGMYQTFRLPEGKPEFVINHIVCAVKA